ncbi:response regulator transcription factor [Sphingorhabdus buctiana]|uniref:Response regulator transcription factor n=1 Tax=Sphingorhabdus buctiana TaxID=1508805 RepID=A0ABW4M8H3_9SPHN
MRIAIADDESDVVDFLKNIVEDMGHAASTFSDGATLSQALVRETYDLVIMDWSMPKKDGMATLGWMQTSLQEKPPVIMLTNRTAKRDISDALNAGADDYHCADQRSHPA